MLVLYNARHDLDRYEGLTPFDTNWGEGDGATLLTTQDLFFGDAISIPTAPTKFVQSLQEISNLQKPRLKLFPRRIGTIAEQLALSLVFDADGLG